MKREEIKAIFADASDEQLKAVLDLAGADIEKHKSKIAALEGELAQKNEAYNKLSSESEAWKTAANDAKTYKEKLDALQQQVAEKEKSEALDKRFNAACGDKKFTHEAVKAAYRAKFADAAGDKSFEGKTDDEILHALTKDDPAAFVGVQAFTLAGGAQKDFGVQNADSAVRAVMGLPPLSNK